MTTTSADDEIAGEDKEGWKRINSDFLSAKAVWGSEEGGGPCDGGNGLMEEVRVI